jgi:hypothetical protein
MFRPNLMVKMISGNKNFFHKFYKVREVNESY